MLKNLSALSGSGDNLLLNNPFLPPGLAKLAGQKKSISIKDEAEMIPQSSMMSNMTKSQKVISGGKQKKIILVSKRFKPEDLPLKPAA